MWSRNRTLLTRIVNRRTFSSPSSSAAAASSIRLYRILQRQCQELQTALQQHNPDHKFLLIQPPLVPHQVGSYKSFQQQAAVEPSVPELWRLFVQYQKGENLQSNSQDDSIRLLDTWHNHLRSRYRETSNIGGQDDTDLDQTYLSDKADLGTDTDSDFDSGSDSSDDSDEESDVNDYTERLPPDEWTLWTDIPSLKKAIRLAFRFSDTTGSSTFHTQQLAIAAYQLLLLQQTLNSLASTCVTNGIRVTATSTCIGRSVAVSSAPSEIKYRFTYRIRVENCTSNETVQLLGRTWNIQEFDAHGQLQGEPLLVQAPQTGAVGRLPVLQPGHVFEYSSGAELATPVGEMKGCFHMARVPASTPSAQVGMPVSALMDASHHAGRFEAVVKPFPLNVAATQPGLLDDD